MSEFLAAALIFGGFWFWTFSAFIFFVIMAFSENEKNFMAFVSLAAFIVIMEWAGTTNILHTITSDPLYIVKWTVLYFVMGSVWSIVKWFSFVRNTAEQFGELKLKYIERINEAGKERAKSPGNEFTPIEVDIKTVIPESSKEDFLEFLHRQGYLKYSSDNIFPSASENKDRLVSWIVWWPTSALWTLINDPIRKIAEKLYAGMQGIYSRISQQAFKKYGA
jgi:hypothetical protein